MIDGIAWFGFWIFLAVFVACDCWLFSKGHDTFFQTHKTPEEKEIQQIIIQRMRGKTSEKSLAVVKADAVSGAAYLIAQHRQLGGDEYDRSCRIGMTFAEELLHDEAARLRRQTKETPDE